MNDRDDESTPHRTDPQPPVPSAEAMSDDPSPLTHCTRSDTCLAQLRAVLDQSRAIGLAIIDADGRAEYLNPGMRLLIGAPPPGRIGERFAHPDFASIWATTAAADPFVGRVTMGDGLRVNRGVFAWAWRREDRLLIVAELDVGELEHVTNELLQANREVNRLQRELLKHNRLMEHLAFYDELTGLPNRRLLADRVDSGMRTVARHGMTLAVCYFDLDGFKPINDRFGHDVGDRFLAELAKRLRTSLRADETLARVGGDEFVVVYLLRERDQLVVALERLLRNIAEPVALDGELLRVTASVGATLYPDDDAQPDVLLRHADQAMYEAKEDGRNRFHVFDPYLDRRASDRQIMRRNIQQAIDEDDLRLLYQPVVNLRSGRVESVETLVRWQNPQRGLLSPVDFFSAIEGSELSVRLDIWVLEHAAKQYRGWLGRGVDVGLTVNMSLPTLLEPGFADRLDAILSAKPKIEPQRLNLEIRETSSTVDSERLGRVLGDFRALGLCFGLDDFGTGRSSLGWFRSVPAQTLKIEQGFVTDMLFDPDALSVVQGVISLARAFDRQVIAKGVESLEHARQLLRMGCDRGQGYAIAKPMRAHELEQWLIAFKPDPRWMAASED